MEQLLKFQVTLETDRVPVAVTEQDVEDIEQLLPDLIADILTIRHARRKAAIAALAEIFADHAR